MIPSLESGELQYMIGSAETTVRWQCCPPIFKCKWSIVFFELESTFGPVFAHALVCFHRIDMGPCKHIIMSRQDWNFNACRIPCGFNDIIMIYTFIGSSRDGSSLAAVAGDSVVLFRLPRSLHGSTHMLRRTGDDKEEKSDCKINRWRQSIIFSSLW